MNSIAKPVAKMSVRPFRYLGQTAFCFPGPDFQLACRSGALAENPVPAAKELSKASSKPAGEVVGFSLILSFLLVVGTMWAGIIVKLAIMLSEGLAHLVLVQNILRTHQ